MRNKVVIKSTCLFIAQWELIRLLKNTHREGVLKLEKNKNQKNYREDIFRRAVRR